MRRLLVHVEGETEETFVKEALAPHLYGHGFATVSARRMGNARLRQQRGGIRGWPVARAEIVQHFKEDSGCVATTMVDYYGLPRSGSGAWPGRAAAVSLSFERKAATVQDALLADLCTAMGPRFEASRFVPYIVMHEFEGLLFSDCQSFAASIDRPRLAPKLQAIRDAFGSPEEINDSPTTAPSKRLTDLIPSYQKPLLGTLAVLEIGLEAIRAECPLFNEWVGKLEALAQAASAPQP